LPFTPKAFATAGGLALALALSAAPPVTASSPSLSQLEARHPALKQVLAYGDQNHWVATLQADLNLLGYSAGPVDGVFGPKTLSGVERFQRAQYLHANGIVNEPTWQDILAGFHLVPPFAGQEPASTAGQNTARTIDGRPVIAVYHMIATAYGPSLQDNYPYGPVDAFGQPLAAGMIAVDPAVIPLKTYVYVTGYHDSYLPTGGFLGHAMDTGGAIKGNRIDVFMNDNPQIVSNFGIQPVTVYVLGQ
jgi:3D (Asp-Asp-Asp) domain-containing protein